MILNILPQFILFNIVIKTRGLEAAHSSVLENNILATAAVIQNTTNELFLAFKLKGIKKNPRLRQYSLIHNFFSTITSQDHDNLNRIALESGFDKIINNETRDFINAINEVLDEDPAKHKEYKDNLQEHVTEFLAKLEYLKTSNGVNNNNFNINNQILNILETQNRYNLSEEESDENDNFFLSDNEFWVPEKVNRRIYQGDKTKIRYFPFMASVQIFNNFQCGGCIIKSDLVISAASCMQLAYNNRFFRENPAFLSVRVGSNFYRGGGESIAVLEVYFHPDYNPKTLKNNLCLLRLVRSIKFKKRRKRVRKIDFDRTPSSLPMTTDGITIVGWGAKGSSNQVRDPWSNQLSFSVLDVYPMRECQDIYSKLYVTQKHFCAGFFSKGGGACNGDVGGPGIVNGILTGIVSFGSPRCGSPDTPTVFTKLGYYTDWIETIMEQEVPRTLYRTTLLTPPPPLTIERYNTRKPTTFVLEPVIGKWKPVPINQVEKLEPLRVLESEDLFKEFLATMFGSKEARDYEEMFVKKAKENIEPVKDFIRHKVKDNKKMPEEIMSESEQSHETAKHVTKSYEETKHPNKFTALGNDLVFNNRENGERASDDDAEEIDRNILKLIENIDAPPDNEIEKEGTGSPESETPELVLDDDTKFTRDAKLKNIDDSILTLLYLSDSEKKSEINSINNIIDDFDENIDEGLSIALDGFEDLTLRGNNGKGPLYDFLPKDEMYDLLAEAIDDVAKK